MEKEEAMRFTPGGDKDLTTTEQFKAGAGAQRTTQDVVIQELKKKGVDTDKLEKMMAANQEATRQFVEGLKSNLAPIENLADSNELPGLLARGREAVLAPLMSSQFGLPGAVSAQDTSMFSNITGAGGMDFAGQTLKEFAGELHIPTEMDEKDLSKRELSEEEKQKKASDKRLIDAWKDIAHTQEEEDLALALSNSGVGGGPEQILTMAKRLMGGDTRGIKLDSMVTDPETGLQVRRGDLLRKKAGYKGAVAIQNEIGAVQAGKPPAPDFLMQIGDGGRVKFAQRIDKADTVTALASKGTGAVQSAGSRSGGGGSSVVINSFGNAAEVIRGIQAAIAAGAL